MMVFVLALTGCGGESQSDADDEKTAQQEDDGWKKAYAKTVQKESADDAEYALIYITDDAIPELLIHDKGEGVYRVYSYCDESSVLALDNMQEDKFCYLEKDNKIIQVLDSEITYYEMNDDGEFETSLVAGKKVIVNATGKYDYYYRNKNGKTKDSTQKEYDKYLNEAYSDSAIAFFNVECQDVVEILAYLAGGEIENTIAKDDETVEETTENTDSKETEKEEEIVENRELTAEDCKEICANMMKEESAYGSQHEIMAANMAQTIVITGCLSENTSFLMKEASSDLKEAIIDFIGNCIWFIETDFGLVNLKEQLNEEYQGAFIYDKEAFVKVIEAFYECQEGEYLSDHVRYDNGKYIGFSGADMHGCIEFNAYDIKESNDYVLLHAPCFYNSDADTNLYEFTMNVLFEKTMDSVLGLRVVYVETFQNNITEKIVSITASSELPNSGNKTYKAENLVDGDIKTAWVENVDGVGIGQTIQIKLAEKTWVQEMVLYNGYQASGDLYEMNGNVNQVSIDFGSGITKTFEWKSWYEENMLKPDKFTLERPVYTDTITITILDAEAGTKYSDTCISEIELY